MSAVDEADLRRRTERRVAAKAGFRSHALIFALVNVGLLGVNLVTSPHYLWAGWPLFGWGIGLAAHCFSVYGAGTSGSEDAVAREMERMS